MSLIEIYTDESSLNHDINNVKVGAWAIIYVKNNKKIKIFKVNDD